MARQTINMSIEKQTDSDCEHKACRSAVSQPFSSSTYCGCGAADNFLALWMDGFTEIGKI